MFALPDIWKAKPADRIQSLQGCVDIEANYIAQKTRCRRKGQPPLPSRRLTSDPMPFPLLNTVLDQEIPFQMTLGVKHAKKRAPARKSTSDVLSRAGRNISDSCLSGIIPSENKGLPIATRKVLGQSERGAVVCHNRFKALTNLFLEGYAAGVLLVKKSQM